MKILVCISNVPDTTTKIKFIINNTAFDSTGVQWIINPWDELALTRALEVKEANAASFEQIVVAHVGPVTGEPTIRKALAIGADKGIRVNKEATDSYDIAVQLAEVVKMESFDIILCGIESSDYNGSAVGGMLAELLNIPSVSAVSGFNFENGQVTLTREIDGGQEQVVVETPFVAIVQKGIAKDARIPSMRGIMTAKTKPMQIVEPVASDTLTSLAGFEYPKTKAACRKVAPENMKELVDLLHNEAKVV
jgi:electron transfer flavoprotein beta subunit